MPLILLQSAVPAAVFLIALGVVALLIAGAGHPAGDGAQIRAQLQAYITQRRMPPFDAQTAYTLVESNPAGRDRELHAARFSEREIEKRHIVSAQVCEGMIDCACWPSRLSMKYLSNEADVTCEGRSLFYYEEPGKTDPRNREVL